MARFHRVKNGVVVNTEVWGSQPSDGGGFTFIVATNGGPGWNWDGTNLTPPVAPTSALIPLEEFAKRVIAESLWDALSDQMAATPARRRIWDQMKITREPISSDSVPVRNILTASGATSNQIDRIMAV